MDRQLIKKIVSVSGIKPGELVCVHYWGEDDQREIMHEFAQAVVEMGAAPLEVQQSRKENKRRFLVAKAETYGDTYFSIFEKVHTVLDIFVYQPVILGTQIEPEQIDVYRQYMGRLFEALMGAKRFIQIRIPTIENAQESGLDPKDYIRRMEEAYNIDYKALKQECEESAKKWSKGKGVILKTKDENGRIYELVLSFMGRDWNIDVGEGDMPCGEIYIAPLEDQTNGEVYFETLYLEDMGCFKNVVLTIQNGVVVAANNEVVLDFINQASDSDKTVCELGFGFNEHVTELCGYTLLDEKMKGTFHIAIGDNTMFGGANKAMCHIDFVGKADVEMIR